MRSTTLTLSTATFLLITAAMLGCNSQAPADPAPTDIGTTELPPDTGHGHSHASEGPHHGSLIELGGGDYHAELVDDEDAGTVTIYLLDGSAKEAVPIDASEITINISHDGHGEQFDLAASPDEGDPEGQSSRFVSDDDHLLSDLHDEDAEATLVLSIDGKSFRGEVNHSHDHGHAHGEDDDHAHEDGDDDHEH